MQDTQQATGEGKVADIAINPQLFFDRVSYVKVIPTTFGNPVIKAVNMNMNVATLD